MDNTTKLKEVIEFYSKNGEVVGDHTNLPNKVKVYAGFQISGEPHLGTYTTLKRVCSFEKITDYEVETVILLADLHSFVNQKDTFKYKKKLLQFVTKYKENKTVLKFGFLEDSKGTSGHQQEERYWGLVYRIFNRVPFNRLKRCITFANKTEEDYTPSKSQLLYVIFQVVDMILLNIDVAIGGIDQRKIHMLYTDLRKKYLKEENLKKIIFIHHNLFQDSLGVKVSKSLQNYKPLEEILSNIKEDKLEVKGEVQYLKKNIFDYQI